MSNIQIINCPNCSQKLRIPFDRGMLSIKCPACGKKFFWSKKVGIYLKTTTSTTSKIKFPKIFFKNAAVVSILIIVIGIAFYFSTSKEETANLDINQFVTKKSTTKKIPSSQSIKISYSDLLDKNEIVRTGQPLKSALSIPELRASVQPFVDKYSFLLQYAVEMINGPDLHPHYNVVDQYPVGSKQPAWVSIFRGGRILITTDNQNHARVFLIGGDPQSAYAGNYSIIRHCLAALLPRDGSNLHVEVFAYQNDYGLSVLDLNREPYVFEAVNFPPPTNTISLDLIGLEEFFKEYGQLEGAKLDKNDGLTLYASKGSKQTIAGYDISLADFAVAYRAVFHPGDNKAFISLDPNKDPTKVTVNFGGFLEDTRMGSVVLEADKRFKTITTGLDPDSFKDMRDYTREFVPTFLTSCERELLIKQFTTESKWIGTRFWFYPESIEVDTDFGYEYAKIIKPQFTADAERSKDDFSSIKEFEKKKQEALSPSIRKNIDHLNQYYWKYEMAYPVLHELTSVARLMGICSWLERANPCWLDLDALLAVDLPPFRTDRCKAQLLSTTFLLYEEPGRIDENYVKNNSKTVYLSPILEKTVKNYFLCPSNVAKYLCYKNNVDQQYVDTFESKAMNIFINNCNDKVGEIVREKEDLKALASYAADDLVEKYLIEPDRKKLEILAKDVENIKRKMKDADIYSYNSYVDKHNQIVEQYEKIRIRLNRKIDICSFFIVEIGGGINLESEHFNIKQTSKSFQLQNFQNIAPKTGLHWKLIEGGKWIRSRNMVGGTSLKNVLPKVNWASEAVVEAGGKEYEYLNTGTGKKYWVETEPGSDNWRDMSKFEGSSYRERMYKDSEKVLYVAEFKSGNIDSNIVGKIVTENKIVFSKSPSRNLIKPEEPPIWWKNE